MERKVVDFHAHAFHDKIAIKAAEQLRDYYGIELAENGISILDVYQIQTKLNITKEQIEIYSKIACEVKTGR